MLNFAIYKIKFLLAAELNFETMNLDLEFELKHALLHFSCLLKDNDLNIFKVKDDGTADKFPNYCWSQPDADVFLLRLNNRQLKHLVLLKEDPKGGAPQCVESQVESNPYCYIIIDCRKEYCQIAIQKSPAWKSDPDVVRNLLQDAFSWALRMNHGVQVIFDPKMQPTKIWEYCDHRVKDLKDPIRTITLEVDNPDLIKDYTAPDDMGSTIKSMTDCVKSSGAVRAMFKLFAGGHNPMQMEKKIEDFVQMVKVCSNRAYKLTIGFKRLKAYRCDEKVKAMFPLHKDSIESFKHGDKVLDDKHEDKAQYALVQWLDFIDEETKNYEVESQIHRPRKNRNK